MPIRFTFIDALGGSRPCGSLDSGWGDVPWALCTAGDSEPLEALEPAVSCSRFLEKRDFSRLIEVKLQQGE